MASFSFADSGEGPVDEESLWGHARAVVVLVKRCGTRCWRSVMIRRVLRVQVLWDLGNDNCSIGLGKSSGRKLILIGYLDPYEGKE